MRRPPPPVRLPLQQRRELLAAHARRDLPLDYISAQLGAPCCAVASGIAVYWLIGVARFQLMFGGVLMLGDWFSLGLLAVIICWLSWFVLHCLLISFSVHRYFREQYDYTARLLMAEELGPVLAQEEYWRPLYGWRRGLAGSPQFPEMSSTLEGHIAFAACFMESLRDVSRGAGSLRRYYILQGYSRWQLHQGRREAQPILEVPLWFGAAAAIGAGAVFTNTPILLALAAGALAGALGMWLLLGALLGPLQLLMRARTAALCDFLLGRLDDCAEVYAQPPGEESWWLGRWFVDRMGRTAGRS